jgi:hypothetical protein
MERKKNWVEVALRLPSRVRIRNENIGSQLGYESEMEISEVN